MVTGPRHKCMPKNDVELVDSLRQALAVVRSTDTAWNGPWCVRLRHALATQESYRERCQSAVRENTSHFLALVFEIAGIQARNLDRRQGT